MSTILRIGLSLFFLLMTGIICGAQQSDRIYVPLRPGEVFSGDVRHVPKNRVNRPWRMQSSDKAEKGIALLDQNKLEEAAKLFREALAEHSTEPDALLGMARFYQAKREYPRSVQNYRAYFFPDKRNPSKWYSYDPGDIGDFALSLNKAGEYQESIKTLARAAHYCSYRNDHETNRHLLVDLPTLDNSDAEHAYSAKRFEAISILCRALKNSTQSQEEKEAKAIKRALELDPASAAAHYYMANYLYSINFKTPDGAHKAKMDYQKARKLTKDAINLKAIDESLNRLSTVK